jgi:hypothetical protein
MMLDLGDNVSLQIGPIPAPVGGTMHEKIQEGFDVFLHDGDGNVGAVRQVRSHDLVIYIENAGDFIVPMEAVKDADAEKVILDSSKLTPKMLEAIRVRENAEDPKLAG